MSKERKIMEEMATGRHSPVCLVVLLGTEVARENDVRKGEDYGRDGHRLTFTCLFGGVARCRRNWRRQR